MEGPNLSAFHIIQLLKLKATAVWTFKNTYYEILQIYRKKSRQYNIHVYITHVKERLIICDICLRSFLFKRNKTTEMIKVRILLSPLKS